MSKMNANKKNIRLFFDFKNEDRFYYLDPSSITYEGVKQILLHLDILKMRNQEKIREDEANNIDS